MPVLDFSHLSREERLQLVDELLDSLEPEDAPLTEAQTTELRRRLATLDDDVRQGKSWDEFQVELNRKYL